MMKKNLALILLVVASVTACASAQSKDKEKSKWKKLDFCSTQNYSWGDKESFRELREVTMAAVSSLTIDGLRNGGIAVKGSDRSDILVRACVQAWDESQESAKERVAKVKIETGSTIEAVGLDENKNVSVSYQIHVPRKIDLNMTTINGGIIVDNVEGNVKFEASNGGIIIEGAGGDVRGRTRNGGIVVKLAGSGWRGAGLDVETTNGGVKLEVPENFAADIECSTVNGGFSSDLKGLTVTKGRYTGGRASGSVNGGGAKVRVVTTNGGISINTGGAGKNKEDN